MAGNNTVLDNQAQDGGTAGGTTPPNTTPSATEPEKKYTDITQNIKIPDTKSIGYIRGCVISLQGECGAFFPCAWAWARYCLLL